MRALLHVGNLAFWRDVLLTSLAPMIWGSTYIVTSEILPSGRPVTAAVIRTLPAGLLLLAFASLRHGREIMPVCGQRWRVALLGTLNIGIFQALLFVTAYRLPGGLAAVLGSVQPLLVLGLSWGVDGRRPAPATLGGALAGVVGMAVMLLSPRTVADPLGVAAALVGAASMAVGLWLTGRWQASGQVRLPVLALTGWQLLTGAVLLAPIAGLLEAPLPALTWSQWLAYAWLCLGGAVLAYALMFRGTACLPAVAVSSLGLLSPLTAVLLGWAFLGQAITGWALVGLVAVLLGVLLVQYTGAASQKNSKP